jgi:hypothetical protein
VVAGFLQLFMPEKAESPAMHKRWRIGFAIFAVLYSGLVWFWQYRTTSEDEIKRQNAIIQNSGDVRKIVKEEDQGVVTSLNTTISTLSDLVSKQQTQINDIHNSSFVTGKKPVQVEIANPKSLPQQNASAPADPQPDINVSSMSVASDRSKYATEFILTTNKVMNGGDVIVKCANPFKTGTAQISGAGVQGLSGSGMLDSNTYETGISFPNWSPRQPLTITLYFDDRKGLGQCKFTPR